MLAGDRRSRRRCWLETEGAGGVGPVAVTAVMVAVAAQVVVIISGAVLVVLLLSFPEDSSYLICRVRDIH